MKRQGREKQLKNRHAKAYGTRVKVSTIQDWQACIADKNGGKIADGHSIAEKTKVSFTSKLSGVGPVPIGRKVVRTLGELSDQRSLIRLREHI